jgi:transcriptional antiterminator NusG
MPEIPQDPRFRKVQHDLEAGNPLGWYVAFVMTGSEEEVKRRILARWPDVEVLVPLRALRERRQGRWKNVQPCVFPGYIFIHAAMTPALYFAIRSVLDIFTVLKQSGEAQPVRPEEIDKLNKLLGGTNLITFSRVRQQAGRVIVESGPLKGLEGLIVSADRRKGRIKIRLEVNGIAHLIDVGAEWIADE